MSGRLRVELTEPQIRILVDAANLLDVDLEDKQDGRDPGYDRAQAARERATLDRASDALLKALPRSPVGAALRGERG